MRTGTINENILSSDLEYIHSFHSERKASQRSMNDDKVRIIMEYGKAHFKQGLIYYVLGDNDYPDNKLKKDWKKYRNSVVIVAGDNNEIVTCYRNNSPYSYIKKKSKVLK